MRTYDFSPLFRSTVGFDRMQRLLDSATRVDESALAYPPYNIDSHGEDNYRITMAVAGFGPEDLEVTAKANTLTILGKVSKDEGERTYLHRGIAGRSFERRFDLADHIQVVGANLTNGLLQVDLVREIPEAMRPRRIEIGSTPPTMTKKIETKAA